MDTKDIEKRFAYHSVTSEQKISLDDIRIRCAELAHAINNLVPEGREQSLAITTLETVMFWADAGLARSKDATSH